MLHIVMLPTRCEVLYEYAPTSIEEPKKRGSWNVDKGIVCD